MLPTDIVNHNLKIAIEVQSWFHDFEYQKEKDEIKKKILDWKKDYEVGSYSIPEPKIKKFLFPVSKYDLSGKLIKKYANVLEAAKEIKRNDSYAILENINGKRKQLYGYIYKRTIS